MTYPKHLLITVLIVLSADRTESIITFASAKTNISCNYIQLLAIKKEYCLPKLLILVIVIKSFKRFLPAGDVLCILVEPGKVVQ